MLSLLQSAGDKPQGLMGHSKHFIMAYSSSSMLLFYSYLCFSVAGHSWRPEEEELTLSVSRVLEQLAEYAVCALWTAPPTPPPPRCCCCTAIATPRLLLPWLLPLHFPWLLLNLLKVGIIWCIISSEKFLANFIFNLFSYSS